MTTPDPNKSTEQQQDSAPPAPKPGDTQAPAPPENVDGKSVDPPQKAERPANIAEEFWDADKGAPKLDAILEARAADQVKLGELQSRAAQVPDKPDGYTTKLDDVKAHLPAELKLPEGFELEADDSPRMVAGKKLAHDLGIPASEWPKMVAFRVQEQIAENAELEVAAAGERAKLGEKGPARIAAVETWLKGKVGEEFAAELYPMMFTERQIVAFERLCGIAGPGVLPRTNLRETGKPKLSFEGMPAGASMIHAARTAAGKN